MITAVANRAFALATKRLTFMVQEATRITKILEGTYTCDSCAEEATVALTPQGRTTLSREFRALCEDIRLEVQAIADTTDPAIATRAALANPDLPAHVRASIEAAVGGGLQAEPKREQ